MKKIPLTQGKIALVDDEDYEEYSRHRWYAGKSRKTFYAGRKIVVDGEPRVRLLTAKSLALPHQCQ